MYKKKTISNVKPQNDCELECFCVDPDRIKNQKPHTPVTTKKTKRRIIVTKTLDKKQRLNLRVIFVRHTKSTYYYHQNV